MSDATDHLELATWDGAYGLGGLSEEDRRTYEAHLATCPACRGSVEGLRAVVAAFADVPPTSFVADDGPEPPETLLPGLIRRARTQRTRRRWWIGVAAAAVVAVLVGGAAVLGYRSGERPTAADGVTMTKVADVPVRASILLTAAGGGTQVWMWCSYDGATASPGNYWLVVRSRSGATERLAAWPGVPGDTTVVRQKTELPSDQIASVEITNAKDKTVLRYRP